MCSLQTSTGTALTHREEENRMTGAAVDEEDEVLLFFCRLAGGEVDELLSDIKRSKWKGQMATLFQASPQIRERNNNGIRRLLIW